MDTDLTILLLTYNRSDLLDFRLSELARLPLADHNAEVLVIDNGSTDGTPLIINSYKNQFRQRGEEFASVRIMPNIGFGPGFNHGAKHARGQKLIFLSNDVRVFGDFLFAVEDMLNKNPRGVVCQSIISKPSGWNQFGELSFAWPAGYFLAATAETWNELGGFDERFQPCDYEDVDLGYRALADNRPLIEIDDLPIEHLVAQTIGFSPERYEQTVRMRALFAAKHNLPNEPERP